MLAQGWGCNNLFLGKGASEPCQWEVVGGFLGSAGRAMQLRGKKRQKNGTLGF